MHACFADDHQFWDYARMFETDKFTLPKRNYTFPKYLFLLDFKKKGLKAALENSDRRPTVADEDSSWISEYRLRLHSDVETSPRDSPRTEEFDTIDDINLEFEGELRLSYIRDDANRLSAFEEQGWVVYRIIISTLTTDSRLYIYCIPGFAANHEKDRNPYVLYTCIIKMFAGVSRLTRAQINEGVMSAFYSIKMLPDVTLSAYYLQFKRFVAAAMLFLQQHFSETECASLSDTVFAGESLSVRFVMSLNSDYEAVRRYLAKEERCDNVKILGNMYDLARQFGPKAKSADNTEVLRNNKRKIVVDKPQQSFNTVCVLCDKRNHIIDDCFHLERAKKLMKDNPARPTAKATKFTGASQQEALPLAVCCSRY
jgi:hypothetical protein